MSNNNWKLGWFYIDDIYTLMSGYGRHTYLLQKLSRFDDNKLKETMIDDGVAGTDSKLIGEIRQIIKKDRPCLNCPENFDLPGNGKDPFEWIVDPWPTDVKVRQMPADLSNDIFITPKEIFIPHDFRMKGRNQQSRAFRDDLRKRTAGMGFKSFEGDEGEGFEYLAVFNILEELIQTFTFKFNKGTNINTNNQREYDSYFRPLLEGDNAASLKAIEDYATSKGISGGADGLLPARLQINANRDMLSHESAISATNGQLIIELGMIYENNLRSSSHYGREINPVPGGAMGEPC